MYLSVAGIIWLNVFVSIRQVNAQLARGVELDRTVSQLQQSQKSNAELEALKNLACRALETRSVFFSEASHDFRQRLHAAKLWVSSAMAATKEDASPAHPLVRLGQELDALQAYIDQVLDFARLEALDVNVHLAPTRIQSLFQRLDLSFENSSGHTGAALRFRRTSAVVSTDARCDVDAAQEGIANETATADHCGTYPLMSFPRLCARAPLGGGTIKPSQVPGGRLRRSERRVVDY